MQKLALLFVAVTLAGCASTRQEWAAEFQRELPQLVTTCNGSIDETAWLDRRDAFEACRRLAVRNSLNLADPAAVSAYERSVGQRSTGQNMVYSAPYAIPMPLPQVQ
jgi:hypothetical protein